MRRSFISTTYRSVMAIGLLPLLMALFVLTACDVDPESADASNDGAVEVSNVSLEAEDRAEGAIAERIRGRVAPATMEEARASSAELPSLRGEETAVLTYAPEVPAPTNRDYATRVIVDLEVKEVVKELADGVAYEFWTFGGEVPGPMIRVREGDFVEFHLKNHPSSQVPHNIDLHAVTGPHGGGEVSMVSPGQHAAFAFRAIKPGLYVYHCATPPVELHMSNGMYGLILVEPKEGLPEVDREYYVMQSEFYTEGTTQGLQGYDQARALREDPSYVVFNGGVGAIGGEHALQAAVGETVRLYVGNGGPNLTSSFHVIGEMFDDLYGEGGTEVSQRNVQTTLVPAGGAVIVDFEVDVPGSYALVDHAIFRAMNKGAVGTLKVVGPENPEIFTGRLSMQEYQPDEVALRQR